MSDISEKVESTASLPTEEGNAARVVPAEDANGIRSAYIDKNGESVLVQWTKDEEARVVRKADYILIPILALLFTWMAIDRTNISGVLTTSFMKDTGMTRDQANTGVSLLWLGIVILEIPANIVLHRIGPHYWIPGQVIIWGVIECLQSRVTNAGGWYAARLFLGLAESGFIPGGLYTISRWYTKDEIARRTVLFFFGPSISASFGSLIAVGGIKINGKLGLHAWQWIFIIDGAATIASGILAYLLLPTSPHNTKTILFRKGWLSEREADVFAARLTKNDPTRNNATQMKIAWSDITAVLGSWYIWPHLIMCLSGLQAVGGFSTWGAVIIKSLGFTSIRANLLQVPMPIVSSILGFVLAFYVDRYKQYGYAIIFCGIWTLAGLVALYKLPVLSEASWSFYAAYFVTVASPMWQPLNVTWVTINFNTPQKRAIAYAVYIGCSNLGGTYGNQVFRASDAPKYTKAWIACIVLGVVWLLTTALQTALYRYGNWKFSQRVSDNEKNGVESIEETYVFISPSGKKQRYIV